MNSQTLPSESAAAKKQFVLVDGHALAYRMYFALERTNMHTSEGQPTWAIHGFFNALFQLLKEVPVDALAFTFDVSKSSFRTQLYPEYKANRASMPDALRQQMPVLLEAVQATGLPLYHVEGVEADDVIGTLSLQVPQQHPDWNVTILTGDQDAFQLIDEAGRVSVLVPSRLPREGLKRYDWQAVIEKWGVTPAQVTDCKGLKGDTSDNIPGVKGIGDKTAAKLLNTYPTLEAIYENIHAITPAGVKAKLEAEEATARLSKTLAIIKRDVELEFALETATLSNLKPYALQRMFQQLELNSVQRQLQSLAKRLNLPIEAAAPAPSTAKRFTEIDADDAPLGTAFASLNLDPDSEQQELPTEALPLLGRVYPHYSHRIVGSVEELAPLLEAILTQPNPVVAIDVETTGLDPHTAEPVGIALSWGNGLEAHPYHAPLPLASLHEGEDPSLPAQHTGIRISDPIVSELTNIYIPIAHHDLLHSQLDWPTLRPLLAPLVEGTHVVKLIHNRKFEHNMFKHWGLTLQGPVVDTLLVSYVLESDRKHGLKALASELLGFEMEPIDTLIGKGKKQITFNLVPIEPAAAYAAKDTYATWCLAHFLHSRLNTQLLALLYTMELPLASVLAELENNGIALDVAHFQGLSSQLASTLADLETAIHAQAGEAFNINSPKQLAEVLFKKLALPTGKKTGKAADHSTDASVLEGLKTAHPIVPLLLDYRQQHKLKSTYIDALPALLNPKTQRVHTSFNQTVTTTGRLSSSDPNLQNIPVRTAMGQAIRAGFVPQAGWQLISADYSQIELRVLAHITGDAQLIQAFQAGADIHQQTAALVFGVPLEAVTKEMRYQAKTVNFGVVYGQGPHGLAEQLGITRGEAKQFIDAYFASYPAIQTWIEATKAHAKRWGTSETLFGRMRNLRKELFSPVAQQRQFAERASFNTPIQGTAADLMKLAMIRLQHRLQAEQSPARLLLQVHDELILEAPPEAVEATLASIRWAMELGQPLSVPLVVDIAVGENWSVL
ncbi:MAG: DNA polymerase I [Vampirovibrionales bacterium]